MSDNEDTKLVTGGRRKEWTHGVVNPPVYRASTCLFDTYAQLRERVADPTAKQLFYGRKGTPTQWALEEALTELEGADGTMLFPSGIAAVTTSILALVKAGDHVLITDSAYEPTRTFANGLLKAMNIETEFYDPMIGSGIAALLRPNTSVIVTESPGSLTFEVQDIPAIVAAAKENNTYVITDNTWATPLFFKPLEHGVDISIEACTKYIGGHSDAMIGSASAKGKAWRRLQRTTYQMGHMVSPDDAFLTSRGLRTLGIRLKAHEEKALKVAAWLKDRPEVATVLHPAFEECPGHEIWARDFSGSTGLFSIVLKGGDYPDTAAMVDDMHLFKMGFSWGGYESLILPSDPASSRSAVKWSAAGPLLRLHIGLEDTDDLIADLDAGLKRYSHHIGT